MLNDVRILLAEDNEGHAKLIQRNLKKAGITNELLHFYDGVEILTFLNQEKEIDAELTGKKFLLLLDINMPRKDGIEVLQAIKSDEILKTVPVIMLTTTDNPEEVKRCHELGCNSYITKPVNYVKFVETLHNLGLYMRIVAIPTLAND
jgi:CheY-like chemotaxis protein